MIEVSLLSLALYEAGKKLAEVAIVDPALEKGLAPIRQLLTKPYDQKKAEEELRKAFTEVINSTAITSNEKDLANWLMATGLNRLEAKKNHELRAMAAEAILSFTDPNADPPEELVIALRWPQSKKSQLSNILSNLRSSLAKLEHWQPLISYVDSVAERGLLRQFLSQMADWNNLMVWAEEGMALRVVIEKMSLSQKEAAEIERKYRNELVTGFYWHSFRGIVQIKQDIRLPLRSIYQELSILELLNKEEHEELQMKKYTPDKYDALSSEEPHTIKHISDILAQERKIVILGDPGSGKTISLRYIALILASGGGAIDLGLNEPLIPIYLRLSDFSRELEKHPMISLENFVLEYVEQAYTGSTRLREFLRLSIEQGKCVFLLDGLDEVSNNSVSARASHNNVVLAVQRLSDLRCNENCKNRIIVTSRIEGYWNDQLLGFKHAQLSPLLIPDEVESFLTQWYLAHEQAYSTTDAPELAESHATERVKELLPRLLSTPSVRRLITNPLLLTILALINENLGNLPNRRIRIYEIAAKTLIESWRQFQIGGLHDRLIGELGEDTIIRIMAPLAYWMHETHPGGTASYDEWHDAIRDLLHKEGFEKEAEELTNRFLHHARFETGLLTERGLNRFGFFHLTFEEYLAARQIARQREDQRRQMLRLHWSDPRWQEVILLAAGQLGIVESKTDDLSVFIEDLLKMEPQNEEQNGRGAVLAGRALLDIGVRSVTTQTKLWVQGALFSTAQNTIEASDGSTDKPQIHIRTRVAAADLLDEIGYIPDDLHKLVKIGGNWIGKYPITNFQYERFVNAPDRFDEELWQNFPLYDENCNLMEDDSKNIGIEWRDRFLPNAKDAISPDISPPYWNNIRYGVARKGVPVVGISWYEANAYCKWLLRHWDILTENTNEIGKPVSIRLPTSFEWENAAGGTQPPERYAWNRPGAITKDINAILNCSNLRENRLGYTTPIWMYPGGISSHGIMDMTGNVWEWQANYSHREKDYVSLRGGSWNVNKELAYVGYRFYFHPFDNSTSIGFRILVNVASDEVS